MPFRSPLARGTGPRILVAAMFLLALVSVAASFQVEPKPPPKKPSFRDHDVGAVPNEWGKLTTVLGTARNYTLVFENKTGDIRILEFRGRQLSKGCILIKRKYSSRRLIAPPLEPKPGF